MRIQLLSDLHLEVDPSFVASPSPTADVLILAGDIGGQGPGDGSGSKCTLADPYGIAQFSRMSANPWPKPVLYLPGNHEFDGADYNATYRQLERHTADHGLQWLDQRAITFDEYGVRVIGAVLWSDFDALSQTRSVTRNLQYREKAFRAANFYLRKMGASLHGQPLLAENMRELSLQQQAWLEHAVKTPYAGKTVVVTHFAPSLKSADPRYGVTPGTAGFCNSLDHLLEYADLWLHGHLHCALDYVVPTARGGCRVVANPLGYLKKNEQLQFDRHLTLEI